MPQEAIYLPSGFVCFLYGAKGRNWFGLSAAVRKCSFCAQRVALLSAFVRCELLSIVGFAVTFAVIVGSPALLLISGILVSRG